MKTGYRKDTSEGT